MVRTLIAGNWKMNGLAAALEEAQTVAQGLGPLDRTADCVICPPATLVQAMALLAEGTPLMVGGQTCHPDPAGAHTGDVSAEMLADAGARYVIVGHSERRSDHGEDDATVAAQARAARRAGLIPIICVGETLAARDASATLDVVAQQVAGSVPDTIVDLPFVVAYEPVWAIGTGRTPTAEQIAEVHSAIRTQLAQRFDQAGRDAPILYGGSLKPSNAAEILAVPEVNGGLIGGASLKADDLLAIYAEAT